ncbi:MAG: DNA polymerase IV, partial [Gaiellaceae bacterium]
MSRAILLIDMDAFYASVEQARRPELAGLPVIVGGSAASRGVVSTASYEARACGVHTAMPAAQAQRLCPQGVFLPVDMKAYLAMQEKLLEIFGRFTDLVEPVSIDEAFLDVTGSRRLFGSAQEIARKIQQVAGDELGLSCSIGVGPTRLLAKLAAELDKPGGLTTLSNDDVHGRLRELPVRRLYGIGPVTEERLRSLGLTTIARLQDVSDEVLAGAFPTGAAALKELAFGGSDDVVRAGHAPPKSMGHEVTFARDINDPELLRATLLDLADRAAGDLRRKGYACRTLALKLRDEQFRTFGGQRTLPDATSSTKVIYET